MSIQIPAILTGFATRLDGGATVRFATNELADTDVLELKRMQGKFGHLLFRPNEYSISDIPKGDAVDKRRTPSKRLMDVKFVKWKQQGEPGLFDDFYRKEMEIIIEEAKEELMEYNNEH